MAERSSLMSHSHKIYLVKQKDNDKRLILVTVTTVEKHVMPIHATKRI